eukprot:CAMPEP_0184704562 /NCGR_PEP_ID=MMETSP0313-20130426/31581_1 /TAXON_ID=2792 /ORGANISM="Porphyridium aerugineum, Strain SAG 1380-2" /LENGTH=100 /DNA_ID=CAMNT_0027165643 /DNA_START=215 /DNA_END=513 /DNA_ORIENTATION=-
MENATVLSSGSTLVAKSLRYALLTVKFPLKNPVKLRINIICHKCVPNGKARILAKEISKPRKSNGFRPYRSLKSPMYGLDIPFASEYAVDTSPTLGPKCS